MRKPWQSFGKKETWFKDLRRPLLKSLRLGLKQFEKSAGPAPASTELPWVLNILKRFEGTIGKTINITRDAMLDPSVLGILAAQAGNCSEMNFTPLINKAKACRAEKVRLGKSISPLRPLQRSLGEVTQRILKVMAKQPSEIQIAFQTSYTRALDKKMYVGTNPIFWESPATRLYMVLLMLAPRMHHVKSVAHLHSLLSPRLGAIVGRDPKRLEKVCQRIGLKFRDRGRPRTLVAPN